MESGYVVTTVKGFLEIRELIRSLDNKDYFKKIKLIIMDNKKIIKSFVSVKENYESYIAHVDYSAART